MREAKYDQALAEVQAAYQLDDQPGFVFKAARAYHLGGRGKEAAAFYKDFLAKDPASPLRPDAERYLQELSKKAKPVWKKGWFWGIVVGGVVIVAGISVGLALGLANNNPTISQ